MALSLAHTRCFTAKQTPQALCIPPRPRAVAARVAGGAPSVGGWTAHHHRAADAAAHDAAISLSRRGFFAITVGGGVYLMTKPALADEGASNTFLGYSLQPDLYLGDELAARGGRGRSCFVWELLHPHSSFNPAGCRLTRQQPAPAQSDQHSTVTYARITATT